MLKQPIIHPSSDAEWKAYYERRCRSLERENKRLRDGIDKALDLIERFPNDAGMFGAVITLNMAKQNPILRSAADGSTTPEAAK